MSLNKKENIMCLTKIYQLEPSLYGNTDIVKTVKCITCRLCKRCNVCIYKTINKYYGNNPNISLDTFVCLCPKIITEYIKISDINVIDIIIKYTI